MLRSGVRHRDLELEFDARLQANTRQLEGAARLWRERRADDLVERRLDFRLAQLNPLLGIPGGAEHQPRRTPLGWSRIGKPVSQLANQLIKKSHFLIPAGVSKLATPSSSIPHYHSSSCQLARSNCAPPQEVFLFSADKSENTAGKDRSIGPRHQADPRGQQNCFTLICDLPSHKYFNGSHLYYPLVSASYGEPSQKFPGSS